MPKINQILLKKLQQTLNLKQAQVYNLVSDKARELMLPSYQAIIALAAENGINITKYASQDDLVAIRQARSSTFFPGSTEIVSTTKTSIKKPRFDAGFPDPFVDASVANSAHRNAELYPVVYLFENSVRNLVSVVMQSTFGDDWWEQKVSDKIKNNVQIRQSEEKQYSWHSQRGAYPIFYTDISDLRKIINTYNKQFKKVFGKIPRVEMWIEEIEKTRNILAHNNPVSKKDRDRLTVFARDWSELCKNVFNEVC
ncbi:MAG: hypothetical protein JXA06_11570 [Bacteroidetes bacterium]|nr:hypothetical protein [Bacteroidota bacterium]